MGLADEPEHAEDAALAVELDIAPLPVVADRNASVAGSTLLFAGTASNCATTFTAAIGDVEAAFRDAPYRRRGSDRKSTRLNSSHTVISYAVFCLKKKKKSIHDFTIGPQRSRAL